MLNAIVIGSIICVANDRDDIIEKIAEVASRPFFFIRNKFRWCSYQIFRRLKRVSKTSDAPVWVGKEKEYMKRYSHE